MLVIESASVFYLYDLQIGFPNPILKAPAGRHVYRKHGKANPKAPAGRYVQPDVLLLHLMDCGCELLIGSRYVAT